MPSSAASSSHTMQLRPSRKAARSRDRSWRQICKSGPRKHSPGHSRAAHRCSHGMGGAHRRSAHRGSLLLPAAAWVAASAPSASFRRNCDGI